MYLGFLITMIRCEMVRKLLQRGLWLLEMVESSRKKSKT